MYDIETQLLTPTAFESDDIYTVQSQTNSFNAKIEINKTWPTRSNDNYGAFPLSDLHLSERPKLRALGIQRVQVSRTSRLQNSARRQHIGLVDNISIIVLRAQVAYIFLISFGNKMGYFIPLKENRLNRVQHRSHSTRGIFFGICGLYLPGISRMIATYS